jgi:hypothetical protein
MEQSHFPSPHREQPNRHPTVPVFVGLDHSQHAVQVCVLDPQARVLCNRAIPDNADAIDQIAQRFGPIGAAREAYISAARCVRKPLAGQEACLLPTL